MATGEFPSNAADAKVAPAIKPAPAVSAVQQPHSQPTVADFAAHVAPQQAFGGMAQPQVMPTAQPAPMAQPAQESPKPAAAKPFTGFSF